MMCAFVCACVKTEWQSNENEKRKKIESENAKYSLNNRIQIVFDIKINKNNIEIQRIEDRRAEANNVKKKNIFFSIA